MTYQRRMKKYNLTNARADLPQRSPKDNKTRGGKCLVIAGSQGKWGAAVLCAQATARTGAGYTYMLDQRKKFPTVQNPDFLLIHQLKNISDFQAIAIGPGCDDTAFLKKCIRHLAKINYPNVVLDAEALNILAKYHQLPKLPANWILTPHEGELSRLLKVSSKVIRTYRKKYILEAQKKFGCIIVLKGHKTLIANKKSLWEIQSGNCALAKAGTGDVLTGMIAGFLSQKMSALQAASLSVYVHGLIADQWILAGKDHLSLLATDLIADLPKTLMKIRKSKKSNNSLLRAPSNAKV